MAAVIRGGERKTGSAAGKSGDHDQLGHWDPLGIPMIWPKLIRPLGIQRLLSVDPSMLFSSEVDRASHRVWDDLSYSNTQIFAAPPALQIQAKTVRRSAPQQRNPRISVPQTLDFPQISFSAPPPPQQTISGSQPLQRSVSINLQEPSSESKSTSSESSDIFQQTSPPDLPSGQSDNQDPYVSIQKQEKKQDPPTNDLASFNEISDGQDDSFSSDILTPATPPTFTSAEKSLTSPIGEKTQPIQATILPSLQPPNLTSGKKRKDPSDFVDIKARSAKIALKKDSLKPIQSKEDSQLKKEISDFQSNFSVLSGHTTEAASTPLESAPILRETEPDQTSEPGIQSISEPLDPPTTAAPIQRQIEFFQATELRIQSESGPLDPATIEAPIQRQAESVQASEPGIQSISDPVDPATIEAPIQRQSDPGQTSEPRIQNISDPVDPLTIEAPIQREVEPGQAAEPRIQSISDPVDPLTTEAPIQREVEPSQAAEPRIQSISDPVDPATIAAPIQREVEPGQAAEPRIQSESGPLDPTSIAAPIQRQIESFQATEPRIQSESRPLDPPTTAAPIQRQIESFQSAEPGIQSISDPVDPPTTAAPIQREVEPSQAAEPRIQSESGPLDPPTIAAPIQRQSDPVQASEPGIQSISDPVDPLVIRPVIQRKVELSEVRETEITEPQISFTSLDQGKISPLVTINQFLAPTIVNLKLNDEMAKLSEKDFSDQLDTDIKRQEQSSSIRNVTSVTTQDMRKDNVQPSEPLSTQETHQNVNLKTNPDDQLGSQSSLPDNWGNLEELMDRLTQSTSQVQQSLTQPLAQENTGETPSATNTTIQASYDEPVSDFPELNFVTPYENPKKLEIQRYINEGSSSIDNSDLQESSSRDSTTSDASLSQEIDDLAQEVYFLLRNRLLIEKERQGSYYR